MISLGENKLPVLIHHTVDNKMTSHEDAVVHFIHSIQKKTGLSAEKAAELFLKTNQGCN